MGTFRCHGNHSFYKSVPKLYAVSPLAQQCYIYNLIKSGQTLWEIFMFKSEDVRRMTDGGPSLYYKLTL